MIFTNLQPSASEPRISGPQPVAQPEGIKWLQSPLNLVAYKLNIKYKRLNVVWTLQQGELKGLDNLILSKLFQW